MGLLIRELLDAGLLHADVKTVAGVGLSSYTREPVLIDGELAWREAPEHSLDPDVLAGRGRPFSAEGGLKRLTGNLGRAVIKLSAVKPEHWLVEAPALVFDGQDQLLEAFKQGRLQRDFVAVVRYQGPRANGMPELHKLTPTLSVLQDRGFKVALVTDGRMSGASGKVPAAIHVTPECLDGGPLAKVRDGDRIRLDAEGGVLEACVEASEWARRTASVPDLAQHHAGLGRGLFAGARALTTGAEQGATTFGAPEADHAAAVVPSLV
jgi:phosphogluconate dehydratase